jgi:hypothetical protein
MTASVSSVTREATALTLTWSNGMTVTLALEGECVLGVREVRYGELLLRNPAKLWKPVVITPHGVYYTSFRLREVVEDGEAIRVITDAVGIHGYVQEEQDEYLVDMLTLPSSDAPLIDHFEWEFTPSHLELDGCTFAGFAFRYRFHSVDGRQIYRIFDDATWEIGGTVAGNTLYLQGQVNPPVTVLKQDEYFTTACNYYGAEMQGILGKPKRVSMQRLPRIGTLQAYDFLGHARGVLFNYFDPVMEAFTIVEKDQGEDLLHVLDELRQPLSSDFVTHPKHILFAPLSAPLAKEEMRNLWYAARTFVYDRERARAGIAPSPVLPRVWIPQVGKDFVRLDGQRVARPDVLDYMAEYVLPEWAEMGVKEICTHSLWVSDYTVDRMKKKNDTGMHGALVVSGICCVRTHEIDPLWGGPEAVARFTSRAHKLGMSVQLWWATHLSQRAPIYAERPDFKLTARDGLPNGGGYGHSSIITLNLANPDCLEWEYERLKAVYEATGVDGFFHDSYGNMTFLPVNYADPARSGQQRAYEELVVRLQTLGLKTLTVEGLGPFGVGHFGMDLLPREVNRRGGYQCALDWWLGQEDMVTGLNMGIGQRVWPGQAKAVREFAFRTLAGGGRFGFTQYRGMFEHWDGWLRTHNQIHARIGSLAGRRTLLPGDRGVLWECADGRWLLFAFKAFTFPLPAGASLAWKIEPDGDAGANAPGEALCAKPWTIYSIA